MTIIDPNGIMKDPISRTQVYGGKGTHGKDLIQRGLIPSGSSQNPVHILTLPITTTETAVLELLSDGIPQCDILSLAGIMAKAPNGIPSAHFLFGPGATKKLKLAVATETYDPKNPMVASLIDLASRRAIRIIETSKMEHDSKMAIIQGLIHLWLVMIGDTEDELVREQLLQHWKTPVGTVVDMIHANPFAEEIIREFFDSLPRHDYDVSSALGECINKRLTSTDMDDFGTPNSDRVIAFLDSSDTPIIITEEQARKIRTGLNTCGHKFLTQKINQIRQRI